MTADNVKSTPANFISIPSSAFPRALAGTTLRQGDTEPPTPYRLFCTACRVMRTFYVPLGVWPIYCHGRRSFLVEDTPHIEGAR